MDENLKTIFYFAGTSGAGKSTRVYALIRFLEDRGKKPTVPVIPCVVVKHSYD